MQFYPGEVLSGGDGVPREQVLQQSSEFSVRLDDRIRCTHEETVAVVKPREDIGNNKSWLRLQ